MGTSKTSMSKIQREKFLRDHGFTFDRSAGGDHNMWAHTELRDLAREQGLKIDCPANLLSNPAQLPWEHCLPDNPAVGTWNRIANHAKWCHEKAAEIKGASAENAARRQRKEEFRQNLKDITLWKHEVKHRLRAGLTPNPAPAAYHKLNGPKA